MEAAADHITAEEYFRVSVEGDRTQLIGGVMVVYEPTLLHGAVQARIIHALMSWIDAGPGRGHAGPPLSVVMTEHDVYGPDVIWYREERVPVDWEANRQPIPDLVVEVRSPTTWRYDIGRKKTVYERGGIPELWLVDTKAEVVLVYRRSHPDAPEFDVALELGGDEKLESPLLPRFSLDVEGLFRRR